MSLPTVSVVIATYNRGERIARTLDSVLSQRMPAAEIVVADDASTDGTASWIRAHYPRVLVFTDPNGGTSVARNRGAARARGDVLVFLDHDDELLPNAIDTLLGLLQRFPEARAAFADHQYKDVVTAEFFPNHHSAIASFQRMRAIPTRAVRGDARAYGRDMYHALLWGNLLQQPWAIYRTDFLALGGFDPTIRYCEDWEMYIRVTSQRIIVLSDQVISTHVIEGENLHRAKGQEVQHMNVLRKHIRLNRMKDWRTVWVLRRRLALYYKTNGHRLREGGFPGAWAAYVRSFATWPFDAVVAARCVAWIVEGMRDLVTGADRSAGRGDGL
jgi:glycosyltransferase involved in cell wall biosynthesis